MSAPDVNARRGGVTGRPAPCLPEPTGPHPVGTTSLYLTDVSRPDPWAAGVSKRELMISLWYPAAPSDGPRAPYMTSAESELQLTGRGITGVPPDALSTVRTNAVSEAAPAGIDHTYESFATAFPDGRVTTCLAREAPRRGGAFWEEVVPAGPPTSPSCSAS